MSNSSEEFILCLFVSNTFFVCVYVYSYVAKVILDYIYMMMKTINMATENLIFSFFFFFISSSLSASIECHMYICVFILLFYTDFYIADDKTAKWWWCWWSNIFTIHDSKHTIFFHDNISNRWCNNNRVLDQIK